MAATSRSTARDGSYTLSAPRRNHRGRGATLAGDGTRSCGAGLACRLAPGAYDIVLTVEDHLANRTFTSRERFEVAGPLS